MPISGRPKQTTKTLALILKNILSIVFLLTTKIVFSQTATFPFAKTIDAKTKKNINLVDIECYRNDSLFVVTTSDLSGEARLKKEYKLKKRHKYRIVVSAAGYQRQYINLDNEVKYPIIILLTKKTEKN